MSQPENKNDLIPWSNDANQTTPISLNGYTLKYQLYQRVTEIYQQLCLLPRRVRRILQRRVAKNLLVAALSLTLALPITLPAQGKEVSIPAARL